MNVLEQIELLKILPVTVFNSLEEVIPTLSSLAEGGFPVTEICFRTECACEAIKLAKNKFPNILIGAGTIINKEQCERAINAGASFIVSPGFSDEVQNVCIIYNIPYIPGVATPTEIMHALDKGINIVKFFPAEVYGGLKAIKALGAAFPQVKFMPTGGIDLSNLKEYILTKNVFAIGGSFLLKGNIVENCINAKKIIGE